MTTTKFRIRQLLFKNDARRVREKNQQKCIDYLKPKSNKNELECKKCVCNESYAPNYQSSSFVIYFPFHNI